MTVGLLTTAIFGDFDGYLGNFRVKNSIIIWR